MPLTPAEQGGSVVEHMSRDDPSYLIETDLGELATRNTQDAEARIWNVGRKVPREGGRIEEKPTEGMASTLQDESVGTLPRTFVVGVMVVPNADSGKKSLAGHDLDKCTMPSSFASDNAFNRVMVVRMSDNEGTS